MADDKENNSKRLVFVICVKSNKTWLKMVGKYHYNYFSVHVSFFFYLEYKTVPFQYLENRAN